MPVLVIAVGVLLLIGWFVTNQQHIRRSSQRASEWDAGQRPDLWTSEATCVHCGARGGLLQVAGDSIEFECLTCGRRHSRDARG